MYLVTRLRENLQLSPVEDLSIRSCYEITQRSRNNIFRYLKTSSKKTRKLN